MNNLEKAAQTVGAINKHMDIWIQVLDDKTKSAESKVEVLRKLFGIWKRKLIE